MKNILTFTRQYIYEELTRGQHKDDVATREFLRGKRIAGNEKVKTTEQINQIIYDLIVAGEPFLAGRLGGTELSTVKIYDFQIESRYEKIMAQMGTWSGMFPLTDEMGKRFTELMLQSITDADVMGVWAQPFEKYYLNRYGKKNLKTSYILDLEPWACPENPWSAALAEKKVLIVHPFEETIKHQYQKREKIFVGTNILPQFQLETLKAVQTVAGATDTRFSDWFQALDWMYEEAMKKDFDIAIIGCGAYGFPLAAKLKKAGKQAIHLGGTTQNLFGIKGNRWVEEEKFAYVRKFFNEDWVRPDASERPQGAQKVEGACYW